MPRTYHPASACYLTGVVSEEARRNGYDARMMYLIYIDDSKDEHLCVFSALALPISEWRGAFRQLLQFRQRLQQSDGIFSTVEFHAWKFVSGRGRIADRVVARGRRCEIFKETLQLASRLPGARLFNAVFPRKDEERALAALLVSINGVLEAWDSYAVIICDEGNEQAYIDLVRRLGSAESIDRVIEDPFFKRSEQSYFIQLADFCAYALLRRERPLPSKTKYGIDRAFALAQPIAVAEANRADLEGIVRPQL